MLFAVAVTPASPFASVTAVDADSVAVAGPGAAVNETVVPDNAFPNASATCTTSGAANASVTVVLCGEPLATVTALAAPGTFVIAKLAVVAMPSTLAPTAYAPAMSFAVASTDA